MQQGAVYIAANDQRNKNKELRSQRTHIMMLTLIHIIFNVNETPQMSSQEECDACLITRRNGRVSQQDSTDQDIGNYWQKNANEETILKNALGRSNENDVRKIG